MDVENIILGGSAGEGEEKGVWIWAEPSARKENEFRLVRGVGLEDVMLKVMDERAGIRAGGLTQHDGGST